MLRISKKVEYALIGMLHMSMKKSVELTTAKELSACYNIPLDLMGKVLQRLAKTGLIRSEQGAKGGYQLNKPMQEMNIGTILKVVDGPVKIVNCIRLKDHLNCEQESRCIIRNPMLVIQDKLDDFFNNLSLQDIRDEIIRQQLPGRLPGMVSGILNRREI
jgi:Rrf2 family protein